MDLQVWRPQDNVPNAYTLVGSNVFKDSRPDEGEKLLYLDVEREDRVEFEPGDIVGMYIEDNASIANDYAIQTTSRDEVDVILTAASAALDSIRPDTLKVTFSATAPVIKIEIGQ